MIFELIVASFAVMLASLIGVVAMWKGFGSILDRKLNFLVSFSAGVFLVLIVTLSQEILLEASSLQNGLLWIFLGAASVWMVVQILPEAHHHHDERLEDTSHSKLSARKLILADSLHNIGDGVLLAVAFGIDLKLGIATAVGLLFHEIVQEMSEFFVLRQSGYSILSALRINFFVSSTILIGSIGGFFLLNTFSNLEIPILGLATGALLAFFIQDLLPHSVRTAIKQKCIIKHMAAALIGALLMFGVFTSTTESHSHGEHNHDQEESGHDDHEDSAYAVHTEDDLNIDNTP